MSARTLTDALHRAAAGPGGVTHARGAERERRVTYTELEARALGLLHHLQRAGVEAGAELMLLVEDNEPFVDAFWAALAGGIVPVPVGVHPADAHRRRALGIAEQLARPFLYTDRRSFERLADFAKSNGLETALGRLAGRTLFVDDIDDASTPGRSREPHPDDVALVQFSSGSTGEPRGVLLTHANILANIQAIVEAAGFGTDEVYLSWMPLTHDMGLIGSHLTPLVLGSEHTLMPTERFMRRPLAWLERMSHDGVTATCSPNFGYRHVLRQLGARRPPDLDLRRLRHIVNGAEPISGELVDAFLSELAPYGLRAEAMRPVYGLAEASLAVTFSPPDRAPRSVCVERHSLGIGAQVRPAAPETPGALRLVGVGPAVRGCELRIADSSGGTVAEGVVGHIQIRGPGVTRGYYGVPEPIPARRPDGWLDTGDLGFLHQGELVVTGRRRELIFSGGQNYYPQDLEAAAEAVPHIEPGKVAACAARRTGDLAEAVVVFVASRDTPADFVPTARAVRAEIGRRVGLAVDHVIPVRRIPKTTSGKIRRRELAARYEAGELDAVVDELALHLDDTRGGATARSAIESELCAICAELIDDHEVGVHDNIFELGTSSLTLALIHEQVDARYPGVLEVTDFFEYPTIASLAGYLEDASRGSRRGQV